jgi:hypothetical protein
MIYRVSILVEAGAIASAKAVKDVPYGTRVVGNSAVFYLRGGE